MVCLIVAKLQPLLPQTSQMRNVKKCAAALVKAFQNNGFDGETIELLAEENFSIMSKAYGEGESIASNGWHVGVKVGDKVFDNIHKTGISYQDWLNDFYSKEPSRLPKALHFRKAS